MRISICQLSLFEGLLCPNDHFVRHDHRDPALALATYSKAGDVSPLFVESLLWPAVLQRAVVVRSSSRSVRRRTCLTDRKMPGDRIWAQRSGPLVYRDARPSNACACERLADAREKAAAKPCCEAIDFFQIPYILIFNSALI
jgi:hypothetical protein